MSHPDYTPTPPEGYLPVYNDSMDEPEPTHQCRHEWNMTAGEADECNGRIYCLLCGEDGDS